MYKPVMTSIRTGTAQDAQQEPMLISGYSDRFNDGYNVNFGGDPRQSQYAVRQTERLCCDLTILTVIQMSLIVISLFIGVWALIRTYEL